ncbi:MerR family transcriptional regulator [Saccharothrix sp. NRRL B-16314]|uniref:MerR family transcriptional regulator n=1 Tax=Saccharothrix sp. NRRL B-16314 TaxID=1463825 RepID=UPI000AC970F4|nr:MerR family transcriptional regulator [Saccharothrix sp. NRRL B-16314]
MVEEAPIRAGSGEQGELFPDSSLPDELVGYRGPAACQIAGITYRQLDYWARTGLVNPTIRSAHGSGSQRLYSFKDILVLKVVKRLLDTGVSLQNIRVAVDHLRRRGVQDLARITLFSDGTTVYECTSPEEVVDLLQGGQGVFRLSPSRLSPSRLSPSRLSPSRLSPSRLSPSRQSPSRQSPSRQSTSWSGLSEPRTERAGTE